MHIQKDVLPYALWYLLCPVSAALADIFRVGSISTSYKVIERLTVRWRVYGWQVEWQFYDAVQSYRPVKVTSSRPFLGSFATVMVEAATSQRTATVPAMAPGAVRLSLSDGALVSGCLSGGMAIGRTDGPTEYL